MLCSTCVFWHPESKFFKNGCMVEKLAGQFDTAEDSCGFHRDFNDLPNVEKNKKAGVK